MSSWSGKVLQYNKISNLKHQITNKSLRLRRINTQHAAQAPALRVTKTYAKITAPRDVKSSGPGMMLLRSMEDGSFVWYA